MILRLKPACPPEASAEEVDLPEARVADAELSLLLLAIVLRRVAQLLRVLRAGVAEDAAALPAVMLPAKGIELLAAVLALRDLRVGSPDRAAPSRGLPAQMLASRRDALAQRDPEATRRDGR